MTDLYEYVPPNASDYYHGDHPSGTSPNPRDYIEDMVNPSVVTGSFPFTTGSYYKPVDSAIERPAVLSAKTIIDGIKWSSLEFPENPHYERTPNHSSEDRSLINIYSCARGILAHSLILHDGIEVSQAFQRAVDDIEDASGDISQSDLYDAVSDWDGAPRVRPREEEIVYDVPQPALNEYIESDAYTIVENWAEVNHELELQRLADEVTTLGETEDGHGYGCRIDRLGYIEDSSSKVPPGLYVGELKICQEWHPADLLQAEAYRRSLVPDVDAEPHAFVARLGPERGDFKLLTSHDDEWDLDALWQLFRQKARWMYEDDRSPYPAALRNVDPR